MQTGPLPKEVALYSDFVSGVTPCVTKTEGFSKECCKRYRIFRETIERDARPVGAVALRPGFTFSFFFRIPPFAGNEISAEISPKFANSERKGNSNSKNEISVNSDRNFGDFDRNFGDFDRKMMSVVIFLLFPRSNEKLLNTNFVQFFEIYNFCFRNFFI